MVWGVAPPALDVPALLDRSRRSRSLHLMPSRKLDGAGCVKLCSALSEAPATLTELDLSGHDVGEDGAHAVGALLATAGCTIERLGLGSAAFGAGGVEALAAGVSSGSCALRSLDLEHRGLDAAGADALARLAHSALPHLSSLTLSRNPLGDAGLQPLLELHSSGAAAAPLARVRELDVSDTQLGPVGAAALAEAAERGLLAALAVLRASANPIGDDGGAALAQLLLAGGGRLSHLSARECGIGPAGAASIGRAAGQRPPPELLDLEARLRPRGSAPPSSACQPPLLAPQDNGDIGDAGCEALANGLGGGGGGGGAALDLRLGGCGCADGGAVAIGAAGGCIAALSLPRSKLGPAGAAAVLGLQGLRRLSLFANPSVGGEAEAELGPVRTALCGASHLEELDLGACGLGDTRLLAALEDPSSAPRLQLIELHANPLESEACQAALAALRASRQGLDVAWRPPPGAGQGPGGGASSGGG